MTSVGAGASGRDMVDILFGVPNLWQTGHLSMASLTCTVGEIIPSILPGPKALPMAPL